MAVRVQKGEKSHFALVQGVVHKEDTKIVIDQALEPDDEFKAWYDPRGKATNAVLEPPFNPVQLIALCTRNNILQQCVHAMEVNIDGTGHTIEAVEEGLAGKPENPGTADEGLDISKINQTVAKAGLPAKPLPFPPAGTVKPTIEPPPPPQPPEPEPIDPEQQMLEDFFKEPYPGMSFITIRRKLRVDLEQCGYGFIEVIRNPAKEILMLRHLPAHTMRLVKLDDATLAERTITRRGKEMKVKLPMRERRFVQMVGSQAVFFKEFGSERSLHRDTGMWADGKNQKPSAKLKLVKRAKADALMQPATQSSGIDAAAPPLLPVSTEAAEVIYFTVDRDATTPYSIPRWINNLPSVIGSRKAEEFNLEFFDAGGLPPAIFIIEGGSLTTTVREQLQQHLGGRNKNKHRGAIVEVQSASGTLEAAGKVSVKVERFGDAKQGDSMFQNYDEKCEEHVRIAFRLPPLFLGKAADYNFATAVTAYKVAEEQVFEPERKEFDEIINSTIVKGLGAKKFKFVSKPITLKDADSMMKGVESVQDLIDGKEKVDRVNEITGMNIKHSQAAEQRKQQANDPHVKAELARQNMVHQATTQAAVDAASEAARPPTGVKKSAERRLMLLAQDWLTAVGLTGEEMDEDDREMVVERVEKLNAEERAAFNELLSIRAYSAYIPGMGDVAEVATQLLAEG